MANPRTIARLQARIQERAANALEFELKDPRGGFVTVTRVELSSDLSSGKIFYSVLGSAADKSKVAHMLESAAGFLQRQIARGLDLRRMPHLRWIYDESIEEAARLDDLIGKALERDRTIAATGKPPEDESDEDWEEEYEGFAAEGDKPPPPAK
jgi:ribosome-binding factor A